MEILLLVLTVGLPLVKFILFPARAMGRGGNWVIVGALMIVGLMMVLWFAVQSVDQVTGDLAPSGAGTASANAAVPQYPDFDKLAKEL